MQSEWLEARWHNLFPHAEKNSVTKEFQCVVSRYSERHRHYHTLEHVNACLHWLDEVRDRVPDPFAVELALWFHDVVYNARKKDSERISAEYAVSTLSLLKLDKTVRNEVKSLILITQHPSVPATENQRWMVDIDLTILGAESTHYDRYAAQVRQEYGHVPDELYRMGRKALRQAFLQAPTLYFTEFFQQALESQARLNLQREIDSL